MAMVDVYRGMMYGTNEVFQLALDGQARKYVLINLVIVGILFGLSDFFRVIQVTPDLPISGKFAFITPAIYAFTGIVTMSGTLIGFTLVYWSASIAFGGRGGLGIVMDLIGLSTVPFWFLAPIMNYTFRSDLTNQSTTILYVLLVLTFIWSCHVIRNSLIIGQGLTTTKATIAVAAMWIFSISAVYVLIP